MFFCDIPIQRSKILDFGWKAIKGIVHPKMKTVSLIPSCRSKPVRPSFIFGTQIKIFLIKSESFLTLHRQQRNYHIKGPER